MSAKVVVGGGERRPVSGSRCRGRANVGTRRVTSFREHFIQLRAVWTGRDGGTQADESTATTTTPKVHTSCARFLARLASRRRQSYDVGRAAAAGLRVVRSILSLFADAAAVPSDSTIRRRRFLSINFSSSTTAAAAALPTNRVRHAGYLLQQLILSLTCRSQAVFLLPAARIQLL